MSNSDFTCPNCKTHIPVKVIALAGSINGRGRLPEFEQITPSPNHSTPTKNGFWNSDVATYVVTGLFVFGLVWLYVWWYGYNPLWAVATGLTAGLGLAVLKTILYAPARPVQPKPSSTTIKVEQISEDNKHWLLLEFDDRITLEDLSKVSQAVFDDPYNPRQKLISREAICNCGLSQPKARLILGEFKRLNYAHTNKQNRTILTRTAIAFLQKVSTLPT